MNKQVSIALSMHQIREFEDYCINTLGVPAIVLMENAGKNASQMIFAMCQGEPIRVAIIAGGGNNAGDGFVIARHLGLMGIRATTFLVADETKITGDALTNLNILRKQGYNIKSLVDPEGLTDDVGHLCGMLENFDLIVDAIGGIGITGALRFNAALAVDQLNQASAKFETPVIAIDIPTGLDCDNGDAVGPVVVASMTISMVASKSGFVNPNAVKFTGEVAIADIGIDPTEFLQSVK